MLRYVILVLALAAPLSALKCATCMAFDLKGASQNQTEVASGIITALPGMVMCDPKNMTYTTCESAGDASDIVCQDVILGSRLGGEKPLDLKIKGCGSKKGEAMICDTWKIAAMAMNVTVDKCDAESCSKTKCNSGHSVTFSVSVILLSAIAAWFTL